MIVTPLLLAQLSNAIYDSFDGFDQHWSIDDVVIARKRVGDTDVLVLRGSLTAEDWLRDAEAVPVLHPQLGLVHSGFLAGMDEVFAAVRGTGRKVAITGHSLGGARARILAGLFTCAGLPVETLCVFGSPKPGFAQLARIIQQSGMAHTSYRNREDIVPTLPGVLDWQHTEPWIALDAAPADDCLESLRDHSCGLYAEALAHVGRGAGVRRLALASVDNSAGKYGNGRKMHTAILIFGFFIL